MADFVTKYKNKIRPLKQLIKTLKELKKHRKKIVFTNGCFDILHPGHIDYLTRAKSMGDILIVGLNSDLSVKKLKGGTRPFVPQRNRAVMLSSLETVDFVVIFSGLTPIRLITLIKPDILVKGGDWEQKNIVGADFVKSRGGKVKSLPYLKGFSTSVLINRIKNS